MMDELVKKAMYRLFTSEDGQMFIAYLKKLYYRPALPRNYSSFGSLEAYLSFVEGQRSSIALIENTIDSISKEDSK